MANLIFDLDGTLWSTLGTATEAWNEALDTLGLSKHHITEANMRSQVGKPRSEILAALFPMLSEEQMEKMAETSWRFSFKRISERGGRIYPGVLSGLRELKGKGHELYIVSNCQVGYIEIFLDQTKTHVLFSDHECWGNTQMEKSQNIKLLMRRNQIRDACYIGDTQGDMLAARKAGLPFIHARYGFGNDLGDECPGVDNFAQLLQDLV